MVVATKKKNFLLFDTLIVDEKYQKIKLGKILMTFNNYVISCEKKPSFLVCKKKLVSFYKKNYWEVLSRQKYETLYKNFNQIGMTYKLNKNLTKKLFLNLY